MYYELALISIVIAAGYWGFYFARGAAARTYGLMLIGAAALSALGLYAHKTEDAPPAFGLLGAVGVGTGMCLLVVGPLVRAAARRLASGERFGLAQRLLDVADVLAPGSGVAEEKALLAAMREIRDGHIEQTIGALTAAKGRVPAEARLAIDERIAMLYLTAYRWDDAIAHAEAHLLHGAPPLAETGVVSPAVALRRALGVAPPVWVELLGAYGHRGDLDQAARMLARLEEVCAGREDAGIWIHRGRMMFLALSGRVAAVEALVAPRHAKHMTRGARAYWVAVAYERHGDGPAARLAYTRARAQSRGRPRQHIDSALERMPDARMIEVPALASEVVARVEAAAPPAVAMRVQPSGPWATRSLAASLIAAAAAIALFVGDSNDVGVAMRAGAKVPEFIANGEWWRLVSCIFVHVGGLHLLVNVTGLWILGRLCENLFGAPRTIAIFGLTGLAGSLASYAASPGVSAGASGAVLGVLGAVFIELTLNRRRHRAAWRRGMWGSLAVVTVAQLAVDFMYPAIDQWAHAGGLFAGTLLGFAFSPDARWARASRVVAIAIAGAFGALCIAVAVLVARTDLLASLGEPVQQIDVNGVTVHAPARWTGGAELDGPEVEAEFAIDSEPGALADWTARQTEKSHREAAEVDVATAKLVALPAGWQGEELVVAIDVADGGRQTFRWVVAGELLPDGRTVLAALQIPEGMAHAAPSFFTALLASAKAR